MKKRRGRRSENSGGKSGAKQENRGKHVPLNFEKGIGTVIDGIAHDRIGRADGGNDQNQPDDGFTDPLVEGINALGQLE